MSAFGSEANSSHSTALGLLYPSKRTSQRLRGREDLSSTRPSETLCGATTSIHDAQGGAELTLRDGTKPSMPCDRY